METTQSTQTAAAQPENSAKVYWRDLDASKDEIKDNGASFSSNGRLIYWHGQETSEAQNWLADEAQIQSRKPLIGIGCRVKCNSFFAAAFEGQIGTITDTRIDTFGKRLWTVTFDTPTPAATNWEPCKTLAAEANCYQLIAPAQDIQNV